MCDDRECDLVWGPTAEQKTAQRKLDELLEISRKAVQQADAMLKEGSK